MAAKSKSPPELKTRRERIIHNERRKLISNLCLGGAIAFLFVLAWEMRGRTAALIRDGDLGGFIFLDITLALVGLIIVCLFMVAWTSLDKLVDPDEPNETPSKRKAKKSRASRSK